MTSNACPPGCGMCCDPVTIGQAAADRLFRGPLAAHGAPFIDSTPEWNPRGLTPREQQDFVRNNWTELGLVPWSDVRAGHSVDRPAPGDDLEHPDTSEWAVAIRCAAFDRTKRTCGAYATRPQICEGFPWYGKTPEAEQARREEGFLADTTCGFHDEVPGRRVLPLIAVNGRPA